MSDRTIDRAHAAYIGLYGYDDPADGFSPEQDERLTALLRAERLKAGDCVACGGEYQWACPWCRGVGFSPSGTADYCPHRRKPVFDALVKVCSDCGGDRES